MKPKILFMGTPEFAVPSLEILATNNYDIEGVVTQPDKPKGRKKVPFPSPVKLAAKSYDIPVFQPERVRDSKFIDLFKAMSPDMVVLAAFGQILPKEIIDFPPMGCINVHPSLLPKYRGAAPINWALIRGEKKTGVTIMLMDEGVDSGDILLQEETDIDPDEIFEGLHEKLALMGAELLLKAVEGVVNGTVVRTPQDASFATYAPRLTVESGYIDWNKDSKDIVNLIRGLSPSPGAYSFLRDKKLKIYFAVPGAGVGNSGEKEPGRLGKLLESGLQVITGDGHVYLQDVQLEGKKRMPIDDFLRGYKISEDDVLE
jgi:methionyl-tRNA formyltransferase